MANFFKRLLCTHWWKKESIQLDKNDQFGMHEFECAKCGKKRVRIWTYGTDYNIFRHPTL
jgi:hypothetical protein